MDTPIVNHLSISCTAKIFPKRIWNKSVELLATPIKMIPNAKNELNVIPIAVSPLIRLLFLIANCKMKLATLSQAKNI